MFDLCLLVFFKQHRQLFRHVLHLIRLEGILRELVLHPLAAVLPGVLQLLDVAADGAVRVDCARDSNGILESFEILRSARNKEEKIIKMMRCKERINTHLRICPNNGDGKERHCVI